jgi:hypothetical protein
VSVTHLSGRHARIDVSLDGVMFTRSESDAAKRGTERLTNIGWEDVAGAGVETTGKGRPVVRVDVVGTPRPAHHRDDPHAVKVGRADRGTAVALVEQINAEVEVRRRWRELAQTAD